MRHVDGLLLQDKTSCFLWVGLCQSLYKQMDGVFSLKKKKKQANVKEPPKSVAKKKR